MVRSSLARISTGGFSVLLSGALLLMIGGLIASDRAVREATIAQARIDAQQSSVGVSEAIQTHLSNGGTLVNVATDSLVRAVGSLGPAERVVGAIVAGRDTIVATGMFGITKPAQPMQRVGEICIGCRIARIQLQRLLICRDRLGG